MGDIWDKVTGALDGAGKVDTGAGLWDFGSKMVQGGMDRFGGAFPKEIGSPLSDMSTGVEKMGNYDAPGVPGGGGLDKGLGYLGTALDLKDIGVGSYSMTKGLMNEDGAMNDDTMSGLHDLLSGGSGALGTAFEGTPIGSCLTAFSTGMDIGDMIAPTIFGDMEQKGSKTEEIPEDGVFKPSCGNKYIDGAIGGIGDAVDFASNLSMPSLPSISMPSLSMPSLSMPSLF